MNRKMMVLVALLGLMSATGLNVWADNSENNSDMLVLTVTPNVDYGVDIDTGAVAMNLGAVDLYASTFTVSPATVTFLGNKAGQEVDLSASVGSAWTFDVSPSTWATNGEQNALAVYALFSATSLAVNPSGDDFANGAADCAFNSATNAFGPLRAGQQGAGASHFEKQAPDAGEMDSRNPGDKAHLWFLLRMPNETTTDQAQNVSVTLTATITSL